MEHDNGLLIFILYGIAILFCIYKMKDNDKFSR